MLAVNTISSSATAASSPNEGASLIAGLPKFTCPAGAVKLVPSSARRTTHGADVYHYTMHAGPGFNAYVPPAGFNPLEASNAVLTEMNMPTRPTRSTALAAWQKDMRGYKGTKQPELCASTTPFSTPTGKHTPLPKAPGLKAAAGNIGWSGYVDGAGRYIAVGAEWYQTHAYNTGASDEVTWVGIGGWNTSALLQDGTDSPGSNRNYTMHAWWEYLGGKNVNVQYVGEVYSGDTIEAQVYYSTASNGTATFYVHDNGVSVLSTQEVNINQDYDPSTVEFINERPLTNNSYLPLSNTGITNFFDANGINPSGSLPVSYDVTGVVMTTDGSFIAPPCSSSTKLLQYPYDIAADTFLSAFCRAS